MARKRNTPKKKPQKNITYSIYSSVEQRQKGKLPLNFALLRAVKTI